jgi:2-methylisocitrate lyase-like PEP mutase family enzyme
MSQAQLLRALLKQDGMIIAPGAYDCISARCVERAGFPVVYMTGAGTAASLGFPDYGLTTMLEMVENAGRMADAVTVPLIADADTGFGNELNVVRAVRAYVKAGVAGIHLEDQVFPKRCGHLDKKAVIDSREFVTKVRAAASEKGDLDFIIIARTDAYAVFGLDEAIARVNAALEAGADVAFVDAPQTIEDLTAVPKRVNGPCVLNLVYRGKTPPIDLGDAEQAGYKIVIVPGLLISTAIYAMEASLDDLKRTNQYPVPLQDLDLKQRFSKLGADEWDAISARYGVDPVDR